MVLDGEGKIDLCGMRMQIIAYMLLNGWCGCGRERGDVMMVM